MAVQYNSLSRAQLSFEYLHTNSTTHEFLFGALAELLDNARDASATKINIFTEDCPSSRGGFYMCFLDDGEGMDPNETADIITFGKSAKRSQDSQKIGMYGNGLKSGSMRIGNDLILFTKKGPTMTCLFISRTFHEEENIDEVIVPIPSFETATQRPLAKGGKGVVDKHQLEMELILKYSPFKTEKEFFAQFDRIEGNCGCLVIVYNLKLLDSGDTELDITSIEHDILLANPQADFDSDEGAQLEVIRLMPEKRSFRAYAAILYMEPRMKVYIQGRKVRTKRLASCLYKPRSYKYSSNRFRSRAENEAKKAEDEAKGAENKAREAESKAKNLEGRGSSREARAELRKAQTLAAECRKEAQIKKQMADRKTRSLKDPKTLNFIFGINIDSRNHDGVFVYNCSRLIRMFEKVGPQTEGGVCCNGIVGVVDVPYLVLEPTHNKQDFADAKEYRHLLRVMGEHMEQYWILCGIAQQVTKFWENFGYISGNWKDDPSSESKYARKRSMQISTTLQCDRCLKWRTLPFSAGNIGFDFPDDWVCEMNSEPSHNRCTAAEQKLNISEAVFKKETKSAEQKQQKLEEEIKKKTEMLSKMQKTKVVTSSRQVKDELDEIDEIEDTGWANSRNKSKLIVKTPPVPQASHPASTRQAASPAYSRQASSPVYIEDSSSPPDSPPTPKAQKSKSTPLRSPSPPPLSRSRVNERVQKAEQEKEVKAKKAQKEKEEREKAQKTEKERQQREREKERERAQKEKEKERLQKEKEKERIQKEKEKERERVQKEKEKERLQREKEKAALKKEKEEAEKQKQVVKHPATSTKTPSRTSSTESSISTVKRRAPAASTTSAADSDVDLPTPTKKSKTITSTSNKKNASSEEMDEEPASFTVESSEMEDTGGSAEDSESDMGTRVEALVKDKWYAGVVVKLNVKENKWKVKFDQNPKDKYDVWYVKNGPSVRLLKPNQLMVESSTVPAPASPASISSHETAAEIPSSSTNSTTAAGGQITDEIANGYRTCLRYFLPPQWAMDKEAISSLTLQELAAFPLDDFFDHYEKGLRKLVNNFQTEASSAKSKLSALRKNIARLLRTLNEEFDIDPEADGEQVDELLGACVNQAVQGQQQQ